MWAFMVAELTWKLIVLVMIWKLVNGTDLSIVEGSVMSIVIVTTGVLEVGYLLGQAALDRYTSLDFFSMLKPGP